MFKTIFVLFCTIFLVKAAEYDYIYENHVPMHENDEFFKHSVQVTKVDDSKFNMKGTIDQLQDITDSMTIELLTYHSVEKEGEKELTKFGAKKNACEFMKGPYQKMIYPHFKDTSNLPEGNDCPLVKNNYVINETIFNVSHMKPFLKPGYWRIEMLLKDGDTVKSGVMINAQVAEIPE